MNITLFNAKIFLNGEDGSSGGVEAIDCAVSAIAKASEYDNSYEEINNTLSDIYYSLRDCSENISDAIESLESNPQRLEEIEERLDLLNRLSRKYNCSCDELPQVAQSVQTRLEQLLNYDRNREELEKEFELYKEVTLESALRLSKHRKEVAKDFADRVKKEMAFLNMPNVELVPNFVDVDFNSKGIDKLEFLISANPGETPKPVAKIASGGELSRMMLAIKTVLTDSDSVDTLIFDEVDTGISGSAAEKVGLKLKEVSVNSQVFCVTHQAQIAALADNHYLIKKQFEQGRTLTDVTPLDYEGRINELARIIGGVNITDAALAHAKAMLDVN